MKNTNALLANLEAQSQELSTVADSVTETLDHTSAKLSKLSLKSEYWLRDKPLTDGTLSEGIKTGELSRQSVEQLGFAKVGDKWQLCTRQVTVITERPPEIGELCATHLQKTPHYTPLHKSSRLTRVKAYNLLPVFLEQYSKMIGKLINDAKEQTAPCIFSDPDGYKEHMATAATPESLR